MKKAVVILLAIVLSFSLFACKNNQNDIITDITKKIAETLSSENITKKTNAVEAKPIGFEDDLFTPFSSEDSEKASKILRKYEPQIVEVGSDCLFDFAIRINDVKYSYHYECGCFENSTSDVCYEFKLSDEDKTEFNKILFNYVPHSNPCIPIENFTEPDTITEPVTLRCLYDTTETLSFTLTKTTVSAADFAINMLKEAMKQETNAVISPVSLITALSMTANGANGDTLKEIEKILGGEIKRLNNIYSKSVTDGEGVKTANSIWIKDYPALKIKQGFIDINKKHYGAEIFKEKFDGSTLNKINRWVSDNTDGLIKNGLDELPSDAVMYLINTVLFDAEWKTKFEAHQVINNQNFTTENGEIQKVTMLSDSTDGNEYNYFTLGKTQGIIKDYANGYSFAALLPDENVTVSEALDSFTGNQLAYTLTQRLNASKDKDGVFLLLTKIPKFEFKCSFKFADSLKKLGMPLAFNPMRADFSGISDSLVYPLYISEVYHNTSIAFTENGTKAGASTVIEMKFGSAKPPEKVKQLYFDRSFIYVIFNTNTGTPLFIGTVRDFSK